MDKMSWKSLYNRLSEKKDGKYKNLIQYIDDMQKKVKEKDEIISQKEAELNLFKKYKDQSQTYENLKSEQFYDVIVKINSIKNLTKGWDILMNKKGEENYNKFINEQIVRIGVIGNENKGKTTILKKISDFDLPTGYSIKTEGLSIKYPQLEKSPNLKIVLLDSAGFETPVLNENKHNLCNKDITSSVNSIYNETADLEFIEMARDKSLTEIFLQNYIIKNSDLLLLVFGKLSFEEQKLLVKIKRDMVTLKRKNPLIVIHNLKEFERISQVQNYIEKTLLISSTFDLCIDTDMNKDETKTEWIYFYEVSSDPKLPKIFHLIFAKEGTEAGNFYNQKSIDYILSNSKHITDKQPFDIINSIKDTFCSVSESILEEPLKNEEIVIEDNKKIKLNNKEKEIKLKKCLIDEIGLSNFLSNGFEPKYEYYQTKDKLIINLEMPGEIKTSIKTTTEGSYTFINITGTKLSDKEDNRENIYSNREYGKFHKTIKLNHVSLSKKPTEAKRKDGIISLVYQIINEDNEVVIS